jgi:AcrR family transcriptional regulator
MTADATPRIASRKRPKQARSTQLVADILQAAAQVLARDGAHRFTTARVAEKAGVSVGSLYQYFPNKEAILFRLQFDEWQQTTGLIERILTDGSMPPLARVRTVVSEFFRTECEEAAMRVALGDAAPFYRDAPEASEHRTSGRKTLMTFLAEAAPQASDVDRAVAADVIAMTMSAVGESVSAEGRSAADVERYAQAVGDMFCAYLESLPAAEPGSTASGTAPASCPSGSDSGRFRGPG